MIKIIPIIYPGLGTATQARVFCQTYELISDISIQCNTRLFDANDVEIINIPCDVKRSDFDGKTGDELVNIVFSTLGIQRK